MNTLTVALFVCLVVFARAVPSGIWGHGHGHLPVVGASGVVSSGGAAGPAGVVTGHGAVGPNGIPNAIGHAGILGAGIAGIAGVGIGAAWDGEDDGQWHGEGLLASQDLGSHGVIAPAAALIGGHGLGLGLGLGHGLGIGHGGHW